MDNREVISFGIEPVFCHAWNADRSELAISPNNEEAKIYKNVNGEWQHVDTLKEHAQRITGIDWAPNTDRIVTCGADRNAYVWMRNANSGKWKPCLVILRFNRAATCVKWSPLENKFAVGSGARVISVCYFELENDWWVSKKIKKPLRSTVTCLDWHPNNVLIAAGSSDFAARVFSAYIKEVEEKPSSTIWGKKMPFGNLLAEFMSGGNGWVHSVSFSASGDKIAWVSHDSIISVVDASQSMTVSKLKTDFLPFMTCTWINPRQIVAAGYDCCPMLFNFGSDGVIKFVNKLDEGKKASEVKVSAMRHFQSLDKRAQSADNNTSLETAHQNTILQLSIHSGDKNEAKKIATSGIDGKIILWDYSAIESGMNAMNLN